MWEKDGERENIEHCGNIASKNVSLSAFIVEQETFVIQTATEKVLR